MFRLALIYVSLLVVTAAVVLSLKALDAGAGVSLAVFALYGASIGLAIAYFLDRIPEISRLVRARHRPAPPRT